MKKYIFDYARACRPYYTVNGIRHRVYGGRRLRKNIVGVVIHYTSGSKDTARNECDYFATGIDRSASAHIFIDYAGKTGRSVPLNRIAYSVGNPNGCYKRGGFYSTLNNANTVSIELCGIANRLASEKQIKATEKVIKWLKKQCPNLRYIVRHYDIVKKACPLPYVENEKEWRKLKNRLSQFI